MLKGTIHARQLKPARRQAYRYGQQVAGLHEGGLDAAAQQVLEAYLAFMRQFEEESIIRDWLINEFILGKAGNDPLSGFITEEHTGNLVKTYKL